MEKLCKIECVAPSLWASYLINGDASGFDNALELARCDAWIKRMGHGLPVSCDDAGFCRSHDAIAEFPYGADCQTYVFLVPYLPFLIRRKYFGDSKAWELFAYFPTIPADSSSWFNMQGEAENGDSFSVSAEYLSASRNVRGIDPARVAAFEARVRRDWENEADSPCVLFRYERNQSDFADIRAASWRKGRDA